MKTLRSKLFLSVGVVLLIVAFLNYGLSYLWIKKELSKAAIALNQHIEKIQEQIRDYSSFVMTYKIVQGAAELDGVSKIAMTDSVKMGSLWEEAARIAAYNPQVAFVQLGSPDTGYVVVAPESAKLYSPIWAPYEQQKLWIQIPEKKALYVAVPEIIHGQKVYLLFESQKTNPPLPFTPFANPEISISWHDSPDKIFEALLANENRWVEKLDLLQILARMQNEKAPHGLLKVDADFKQGVCVLASEAFSTTPVIQKVTAREDNPEVPLLVLRKDGHEPDLDMARVFPGMALGFSLSSLVKEIGVLVDRTILVTWDGQSLGYTSKGENFDPEKSGFPLHDLTASVLTWQNERYVPLKIDFSVLQLTILIPEQQAMAATWFLEELGNEITFKITLSLIGAAMLSFGIALLLINRISRKITGPIHLLSNASEELGKGKYEGLVLPQLKKRHDEIEVLSHSFEKMVIALRDRDKIRGVLNKVVSKEITEEILKGNVELGGEERTLTLLFSDIRGFTSFSEHLQPKELIGLLNEYMTRMCRIIDETHGVVDKFVGDEIMALYGAPVALVDHPVKAIEAAIYMLKELRIWNEERRKRQETTFEIGIGIHTGLVCTGNMGAENRLNYTAIGSGVNLASRICGAAAPMQILVSEETYKIVKDKFQLNPLPPVTLKGIDHPVMVYEVVVQ